MARRRPELAEQLDLAVHDVVAGPPRSASRALRISVRSSSPGPWRPVSVRAAPALRPLCFGNRDLAAEELTPAFAALTATVR